MKKLTELQEQKLQQVMQEYDEAMRKFDENEGRGMHCPLTSWRELGILM